MNLRILLVILLSIAAGWTIWALSLTITGQKEPWDAGFLYYSLALFLTGLLISCLAPKYFWIVPIGLFLGQLGFMVTQLEAGPLIVVGILFLAVFSTLGLIGAVVPFCLSARAK